jgi:hypothetical protein
MLWTGTAFRPPRRDDDEAWQVAKRVIVAGFRYRSTRQRQRFPRTLDELKIWIREQKKGDSWLPERKLLMAKGADGRLALQTGQRILSDGERVLVYHGRRWQEGHVKFRGDGGVPLFKPVIMLSSTRRSVPITSRTRIRTRNRRNSQQ